MPSLARRALASWRLTALPLLTGALVLLFTSAAHAQETWHVDDTTNDGLVAHWKFDEPGSLSARPFVGPVAGSLTNGASTSAGPIPAGLSFTSAGALLLDGEVGPAGDRVTIPDHAALNLVTDFTVAAWVQRAAADIGTQSTLYDAGTNAETWYVGFLSDNRLTFSADGAQDFPSAHTVTDTDYHHIALAKSGSQLVVYLDGAPAVGLSVPLTIPVPSGDKLVGSKSSSDDAPFGGFLDDLRLYDRALSAAEVQRLAEGSACSTDGLSWPTAFRELHCALAAAEAGEQIWIDDGLYRPGTSPFIPYNLKNGVALYGGFENGETSLAQRPAFAPAAPLTVLSGDIAGNDPAIPFGDSSLYTDNSNTVLLAPVGVAASLDGVRVLGGHARTGAEDGTRGGGLRALIGGAVTLTNVSFVGNQATGSGGAIFSRAPLTLTAGVFERNRSSLDGGALYITATVSISSASFLTNTAQRGAGAAVSEGGGMLSHLVVYGNSAELAGGGLFIDRSTLTIAGSTIVTNVVSGPTGEGGGVRIIDSAVAVSATQVASNTASLGGGIHSHTSDLALDDVDLRRNSATGNGGGIYSSGSLFMRDSNVIGNEAAGGGGLYATALFDSTFEVTIAISDSLFESNTAHAQAGGGAQLDASSTVTGTVFRANTAVEGGGIDSNASLQVSGSVFEANQVTNHGGGLRHGGSSPATIVNSLFVRNGALANVPLGAAVALFAFGESHLLHTTIVGPSPSPQNAAVTVANGTIGITNTIFVSHTVGIDKVTAAGAASEDFNLYVGVITRTVGVSLGTNSLTGDPVFVNAEAGDYRIDPGSAAHDTGANVGVTVDFEGQARPADGGFDIGYDEAAPNLPAAHAGGPYQGGEGGPIALDGSASTDNKAITAYSWDCTNDGSYEQTLPAPTGAACTYADNGSFTLRLQVTDSDNLTSEVTTTVDVANVAPSVTAAPAQYAQVGVARAFAAGAFADPGADAPWQATVDWGDNSPASQLNLGAPGAIPAQNHTYAAVGLYTVTVTVRDKDGAEHSGQFTATVGTGPAPADVIQFLPMIERP